MRPSLDLSNRSTKLHNSLSATYIYYAAKNSRNYMDKVIKSRNDFYTYIFPVYVAVSIDVEALKRGLNLQI